MRYSFVLSAVVAVVGLGAGVGWGAEREVHRVGKENVVKDSGRKVEFYLGASALADGGMRRVDLSVPWGSELGKGSQWRVEVRREGRVVMRSPLAVVRGEDETWRGTFEIDEGMAGEVFVSVMAAANPLSCSGIRDTYVIPVAEYVGK